MDEWIKVPAPVKEKEGRIQAMFFKNRSFSLSGLREIGK